MSPAARVRSKALYPRRAVHRALRILTLWPGTARGTVFLCDHHHHRGAEDASQIEQDNPNTQCVVAAWVQTGLAMCVELSSLAPSRPGP
jgi:hypothetical protein